MRKAFDCVQMMHRGGTRIQQLLAGKSRDEIIAFWKRESDRFRREVAQAKVRATGDVKRS